MKFCERKDLIDRQSYVAQYVSLALLTIGVTTLIGSDDLLAAFACGTAFAWDGFFNKQTEAAVFSSVIDLLFNIAAFVFVGAWTPFSSFSQPELTITVWRLVVIALLVLLFRRLPIILLLYKWIPDVKNWREAVFSGHFGPMGIGTRPQIFVLAFRTYTTPPGAVFISTLALGELPKPEGTPTGDAEMVAACIQPIVAFMVVVSIVIHGLSIPFFSLGRRVHTLTRTYTGTRTWSRQPSLPDWAMQTRPVVRGEDIVINRDPVDAAEKGESSSPAGTSEKEKVDEHGLASPSTGSVREKQTLGGSSSTPALSSRQASSGTDEDMQRSLPVHDAGRGEHPDSGAEGQLEEDVTEWKEGPHKIVERRRPDEEVEVTVMKNAYGPGESTTLRQMFPHHGFDGQRAVDGLLSGAVEAAEHIMHDVEKAGRRARHAAGEAVTDAEDTITRAARHLSPDRSGGDGDGDGDDGWASERSDRSDASSRSGRKKKKAQAHALRPPVFVQGRQRRRFSHLKSSRPAPPPPIDAARERGRAAPQQQPAPQPQSPLPRPTHRRIDSLREGVYTREASPTRSVRWADEDARSVRSPLTAEGSRVPSVEDFAALAASSPTSPVAGAGARS
jgi:hypothetical protein